MYANTMRLSFGDYHYEVMFSSPEPGGVRVADELFVASHVHKALVSFHEKYHEQSKTIAEMKRDMYTLAADRPDLVHELKDRGLL